MHVNKILIIFFAFSLLTSCMVGPNYVKPTVDVPTKFKEAKNKKVIVSSKADKHWKVASPKDDCQRGEWWHVFHDAELNKLEVKLNQSNQNIQAAIANYSQARELVEEARASFFPTLTGSLSLSHQKGSGSSSFISTSNTGSTTSGVASSGSNGSRIFSNHSWLLDASWEPDFWGLVRRTVEANVATAEASGALLEVTRLSAEASLAQYYFQLRALDADQKLLNETVKSYKESLQLTRNQYKSGVASSVDTVQAESQLEAAQAQAINNGINRATYEHAIAVLIGMPPEAFSLSFRPLNQAPPPIPIGVPSDLLERRPDIAEAERQMAAANAQIGVATAAFFPTITLTATGNVNINNAGLSQLFQVPTMGWSYGPQLAQLIYDGGLRSATVAAARSGYDSTVANYRQTVLSAFQDVEDNLSSLRILNREMIVQNQAAKSAKRALVLITNQYKAGIVPYSNVITAQINAFTAEKNAVDIAGLRMTSAVLLVKALGGGWSQIQ